MATETYNNMKLANNNNQTTKVNELIESNLIYYARSNIVDRECDSIIITDTNSKIIKILTPHISTTNKLEYEYELLKDNIECTGNNNVNHSINDIYEPDKCCCSKFQYNINKYTDVNKLLEYISNIYKNGNSSDWAGHTMGFNADEDNELTGYYIDTETGKYYWGWVSTHQTVNLPLPRMTKFQESKNSNNVIQVLLEEDEDENGLKISYNGQCAYSNSNMKDEIYERLWDLLHPDI